MLANQNNQNKAIIYPICACSIVKVKFDPRVKQYSVRLITNNQTIVTRHYPTKSKAKTGANKLELAFINMHISQEPACKITDDAKRFWKVYVEQRAVMPEYSELET